MMNQESCPVSIQRDRIPAIIVESNDNFGLLFSVRGPRRGSACGLVAFLFAVVALCGMGEVCLAEDATPPAQTKAESSANAKDKDKEKSTAAANPAPAAKALSDAGAIDKDEAADAEKKARDEKANARWRTLMVGLTVFVLAVFVGFEVIAKVPPTLHTPLMSGSNAISGITIVGSIVIAGHGVGSSLVEGFSSFVGMVAVALAAINVVGGLLVTHRMLAMFKRR